MRYKIIPPTNAFFEIQLIRELVKQLNSARVAAHSDIETKVRNLTRRIIRDCDFIEKLKESELRGSFGIRPPDVRPIISSIIDEIVKDTYIISTPIKEFGSVFRGGWTLAMGTNLHENLKNMNAGITLTEKGELVSWLRWTLEAGNKILISDFRVKFKNGYGRSGFACMIPNAIIGYRIPPSFAGTYNDNWITRAIIPYLDDYSETIMKTLNRYAP